MSSVKFTSNRKEILSAFEKQVAMGCKAIGMTAERYAKEDCPVDTGRLRNSITNDVRDSEIYIGTNVEYAPYIEFTDMSHNTGKAHFLRDAATTHNDEYKQLMTSSLKS